MGGPLLKTRSKRNKGEAVEHEDKILEPSPDISSPKRMDQSMEGLMTTKRMMGDQGNAVEHNDNDPEKKSSPDNPSTRKMDQSMEGPLTAKKRKRKRGKAVEDPLPESPALIYLSSSKGVVEDEDKIPEPSPDISSPKRMDQSMEGLLTTKRMMGQQGNAVEHKDNDPEFSPDNPSPKKMNESMEGPLTAKKRKKNRKPGKAVDPLPESPALTSLSSSKGVVEDEDKISEPSPDISSPTRMDQSMEGLLTTERRKEEEGNAVEHKDNNLESSPNNPSPKKVDQSMEGSSTVKRGKRKRKRGKAVVDPLPESPAVTSLSSSKGVLEDKDNIPEPSPDMSAPKRMNQSMEGLLITERRKEEEGNAVKHKDNDLESSPDNPSPKKEDQSMESPSTAKRGKRKRKRVKAVVDPLPESPAVTSLSSFKGVVEDEDKIPESSPDISSPKRMDQSMEGLLTTERRKEEEGYAVEHKDKDPESSPDISSPKRMDQSMEGLMTTERRKEEKGNAVEHKDNDPESSPDNPSPKKMDQTMEGPSIAKRIKRKRKRGKAVVDPLPESPALASLSSSKGVVEDPLDKSQALASLSSSKGVVEDPLDKPQALTSLSSSKGVENPLDKPQALTNFSSSEGVVELSSVENKKHCKKQKTEHNAIVSNVNSCGETDIFHGENEKEQDMLGKAKENNNGEGDIKEVSCSRNSVVENGDSSVKDSVLDVVNVNIEQVINENSSNPDNKSPVKNASLLKNYDDYPALEKHKYAKTYTRKKKASSNSGRNSRDPSPVNCKEELTLQNHHKDDSQFFDGPSTVDLMEIETKCSRDQATSQSGAATEKMELTTENPSGQISIPMSSEEDIPVVHNEEANCRQQDQAMITSNDMCCAGDVSDLSLVSVKDDHSKISNFPLGRTISSNLKKKLLILDLNGLLLDFVSYVPPRSKRQPDLSLKSKQVFKRPFCHDFLQFCFDKYHVGIWSSRHKSNVDKVMRALFPEAASKLLFCWDQSHCTVTGFSTVENKKKPLVLKELRKLWEKLEPGLPWEKGEFNQSNTLLLDDSPHKALLNPRYTAIFPYSYEYTDSQDRSLGPGGDLRVYLEGLAMADNIQDYVKSNPFGERTITGANPSWLYFRKVIASVERKRNAKPSK